jgi:uncharacterized Rossmann fold enzyme
MIISGWNKKYLEILREFRYSRQNDVNSAGILNSIIIKPVPIKKISSVVKGKTVFVIGSGPSLYSAIPILKNFKKTIKIVADSAIKPLVENGISPDIVVTDLDGDEDSLIKVGKSNTIIVVHAHGDNITKLHLVKNFKNCIGTTQTKSFKNMQNFGGFTDGDRAVFLASYFDAKKIILFGMDFGKRIGRYSGTKTEDREIKLRKLRKGKILLEWLAGITRSELFTTSRTIVGFEKVSYHDLNTIIT